jgi:hypothetical protein
MADATIRRTVQIKFRLPPGDVGNLLGMMQAGVPFYEMMSKARVRILRNVDDPSQFVHQIEYDAPAALELNRHSIASDTTVQAYLQACRMFLPGAFEAEVFEDVTAVTASGD